MYEVSIVIGTFGSTEWGHRGHELFLQTTHSFPKADVLHIHDKGSLARARNTGVEEARGEYIICLDADDYLCDGYVNALLDSIEDGNILYKPITMGYMDEVTENPQFVPRTNDLLQRNELVIGTAFKKEYFLGFDPQLDALEDWDLWIRMVKNGAKVKDCPDMCYAINTDTSNSRNNSSKKVHNIAYRKIRDKYGHSILPLVRV